MRGKYVHYLLKAAFLAGSKRAYQMLQAMCISVSLAETRILHCASLINLTVLLLKYGYLRLVHEEFLQESHSERLHSTYYA